MRVWIAVAWVCLPCALVAQKKPKNGEPDNRSGYDRSARATLLHDAIVYVGADDAAQKVSEVTPGHEVVVIQRSGPWIKVFANSDTPDQPEDRPEFAEEQVQSPESGWIKDKGVVDAHTEGGDAILFGTAANLEEEASEPHAPKDAASAAHLLYRRVWEYFPDSPLASEAAFRSADIRWQLEKRDVSTLPSAKEQESYLRPQLYEGEMKRVMKMYPGSKQAMLAAYDLIDNKLCGDWQGLPKCPEMEAVLYLKYADQFPESPRAAEAMYHAIYRKGVLVSMYNFDEDKKRADDAAKQVQALAAEMKDRFGKTDYAARAQSIAYKVRQGIPIFGSDRD
ncbi:hypothetical protein FTO74_03300 [Granulicella sp. WH15]|nr:hypothetical protein FTO74_03300 [Granulicella sp. WH15]